MKNHCRWLLSCAAVVLFTLTTQVVKASPYASCITNNNGTITFYLNESGGNVVVTYGDGTTNANFNGQTTGLNLNSGSYTFSLSGESSYSIAVTKMGSGVAAIEPNVIQNTNNSVPLGVTNLLFILGDPRGVAVNINPTSPCFGRIYVSRGGNANVAFFDLNSDGTFSTAGPNGTNAGVTTWSTASPYSSPDRISIAANDDLVVGDWSAANAGVWLIDPNLATNQLLLGPVSYSLGNSGGVHGDEVGTPVLLGNPATNATLLTVDSDLSTVLPNTLLVYSNITSAALAGGSGWQNPPSLVGPEVAINYPSGPSSSVYLFPSLCVGPNGYIYSGEYRGGSNGSLNTGDPAGVQVYGLQITNKLWTSRYNGGASDYFCTAATHGGQCLPTDLAVSPDGKYLATVGVDNHLTICVLTNGIPDVATIFTVAPRAFGFENSDGACEVKWDLADNLYVLAAGTYGLTTWSLGQSATCTTSGNANGSTNFSLVSLKPSVSVYATNAGAISQPNSHGNPTSTVFTIVRAGGISAPLTVNFSFSGTAPASTYTAGSSGTVVFAAGQSVTNITVTAVSDGIARLTTYLTLGLASSGNYTLVANSATISILNTATPNLVTALGQSSMYNAFSNDYCSIVVTRLGDTNTTEPLNSFTLAGTGVAGTDFTAPSTNTFVPGDLTHTVYIYPLVGGHIPTHNPNLPYSGNKTVILGLSAGSGYTVATNTAALTIVDSAYPPATLLFSDPLTNATDAANWGINAANGNLDNVSVDANVQFGANLYNTPGYPVPPPPSGATNALMMTVNKSGGLGNPLDNLMTGVNAYFTNMVFGGNYAVRFNMNILQGDSTSLESGSYDAEEGPLFGANCSGTATNFWAGSGFVNIGNSQTNFIADGIWYWVSDDGGRYDDTFGPYLEFTGLGGALPNTGWTNLAIAASSTYATAFKTNVFTCYASINVPPAYNSGWTEGGPGLPVNGPPNLVGSNPNSWSDVEIKQMGSVVSLWIDKNRIFAYTNPPDSTFTNGFVMLGYEDPFNGGESPDTAVYYSNLRVVALTPPAITGITTSAGQFKFTFTSSDGDLTTSSFQVLGATSVNGPYTPVSGATITQSNGVFQASVPMPAGNHFYRIQQI